MDVNKETIFDDGITGGFIVNGSVMWIVDDYSDVDLFWWETVVVKVIENRFKFEC